MDRNPYSAPIAQLDMPQHGPVSIVWYGFLCLLGLIASIAVLVLFNRLAGIRTPQGTVIVGLLASIQFSSWRFVRTYRRMFLPIELKRFTFACFSAFWVCDECPVLITRFLIHYDNTSRKVIDAIVATGVDFAIVVAIVYATVPWVARHIVRRSHSHHTG